MSVEAEIAGVVWGDPGVVSSGMKGSFGAANAKSRMARPRNDKNRRDATHFETLEFKVSNEAPGLIDWDSNSTGHGRILKLVHYAIRDYPHRAATANTVPVHRVRVGADQNIRSRTGLPRKKRLVRSGWVSQTKLEVLTMKRLEINPYRVGGDTDPNPKSARIPTYGSGHWQDSMGATTNRGILAKTSAKVSMENLPPAEFNRGNGLNESTSAETTASQVRGDADASPHWQRLVGRSVTTIQRASPQIPRQMRLISPTASPQHRVGGATEQEVTRGSGYILANINKKISVGLTTVRACSR
ncbi:hypothetical protein B0H17DRAFT_1136434 [Mycena rosella]|uniref:Uncharacterized protein n=1 Tax=Mycena rosella TaxID=1033263 RepID=A0AAD7GBS8_MYCRO|nr:hypothetical protein B0H17DRAFT_1136434 [Mycena rosella]